MTILATPLAAVQTVSVCIPARNEAETVAATVAAARRYAVADVLVVDDGSVDGTAHAAKRAGARVVRASGAPGKGRAMAEGARHTAGDVVVFLDADVRNYGPDTIERLVAPLASDPGVVMVKGAYTRPLDGVPHEGGRVTQLLARPLLERLFPALGHLRQPLAGEVAIRRDALDALSLEPGYGVEIGMLIDVASRFGPAAIREVDLGERVHRNRPLAELRRQAREVLDAVMDRT